jgi:hypothetical protein
MQQQAVLNEYYENQICPACHQVREPPAMDETAYLEYLDKAWDTFAELSLPLCADCYYSEDCIVESENGIPTGFESFEDNTSTAPLARFSRNVITNLLRDRTFLPQ